MKIGLFVHRLHIARKHIHRNKLYTHDLGKRLFGSGYKIDKTTFFKKCKDL